MNIVHICIIEFCYIQVNLMDYKEMKSFIDDIYQFKVKRDLYSKEQGIQVIHLL